MHVKSAELPVFDRNRAVAFYAKVLGEVATDMPFGDDVWRWIAIVIPQSKRVSSCLSMSPYCVP